MPVEGRKRGWPMNSWRKGLNWEMQEKRVPEGQWDGDQ